MDDAIVKINVLSLSGTKLVDFDVQKEVVISSLVESISSALLLPNDVKMIASHKILQTCMNTSLDALIEDSETEFNIRLSKETWIPNLYKGTIVTEVIPCQGLWTGGEKVQIMGENFIEGKRLICRFGTTQVNGIFVSENEVTCYTPEHPLGIVAVEVSFDGGNYTNNNTLFAFVAYKTRDFLVPVPCNSIINKQTCKIDTMPDVIQRHDHDGGSA
jgi:hypothetical protein